MRKDGLPQVIVLCEDNAHYHFVRAYLVARGWQSRRIRPLLPLPGQGSGEQWVRQKYPQELKAHQAMRGHRNVALIVMIDADRSTVQDRLRQLDREAQQAGTAARGEGDRVAIFVPRRNVETWYRYLDAGDVNEETDYKGDYRKNAPRGRLGKTLAERCSKREWDDAPPQSAGRMQGVEEAALAAAL
jgi:hypothetical protein